MLDSSTKNPKPHSPIIFRTFTPAGHPTLSPSVPLLRASSSAIAAFSRKYRWFEQRRIQRDKLTEYDTVVAIAHDLPALIENILHVLRSPTQSQL